MLHPTLLPGMPAPLFELPNQRGEMKSLADYLTLGAVLLAFHRGTW
jgi:peroxiredoxin